MESGEGKSLSERDQFLIKNADLAALRGRDILNWWKTQETEGVLKKFQLGFGAPPGIKLACFYSSRIHEGIERSVMGCLWKSTFKKKSATAALADISAAQGSKAFESFIKKQFVPRAKWVNPGEIPGGFGFTALQYKLKTGELGSYAGQPENRVVDLSEIGSRYEWVVFQADVFDFFADFPQIRRKGRTIFPHFPKMASYVLIHEGFAANVFPSVPGTVAECGFGYSFLPLAVYPSFLGYGPGRFDCAVKQFRFSLLESGDVDVQLSFGVSPRSEKVLYLRGWDPVYSLVNLLNAITFGALKIKAKAHDKLDSVFLLQHAKVYQALMEGMHEVWEDHGWDRAVKAAAADAARPGAASSTSQIEL